jgi:hypothetical protein
MESVVSTSAVARKFVSHAASQPYNQPYGPRQSRLPRQRHKHAYSAARERPDLSLPIIGHTLGNIQPTAPFDIQDRRHDDY